MYLKANKQTSVCYAAFSKFSMLYVLAFALFVSAPKAAQSSQLDSLMHLLRQASPDTNRVKLYNEISGIWLKQSIDSVPAYAKKGIALAQLLGFAEGEMMGLNALGNYYENKTMYAEALETYQEALDIATEINSTAGFAILYNNMGMVHIRQGRYNEAFGLMIEALKAEEVLGNDKGIAEALNNIGVVYFYLGQFDKATEYFERSMKKEEAIGNMQAVKHAVNNLGAIYNYLKNYPKAIEQYQKAFEINKAVNDRREMASNLHNIAIAYYYMKQYEKAADYHDRSLAIKAELGDYNALALSYYNYGELMKAINRYVEARNHYNDALEIARKNGLKEIESRIYGSLASLFELQGNHKEANKMLYNYIAVRDTILNAETSTAIAEMEAKYETEKKEREIVELRQAEIISHLEINEKKLRISRLHAQRTGLGIAAVFILMLAFFWVNNTRNRKEREKNRAVIAEREAGLKAVFEATESERKRIAKDLHDSVGQQLGGLKLAWQNLGVELKPQAPEQQKRLKQLSDILDDAAMEVRSISHQMMPKILQEEGVVPAIADMLEKVFRNADLKYNFEHFGIEKRLDEQIEIGLFRVCQELVSNIIKHAGASQVNVQLFRNAQMVVLLVEDNGKGFDTKSHNSNGIGLMNIRSRVETIHGEFNLEPSPASGVLATIRIPVKR